MTLCSSHPQQADFGARPNFQATTRFVSKIRNADRWTQKEKKSASTSCLLTQLGRLLMSSSTLFPFFLPPPGHLLCHILLFSFLPRFTPCLLPPPPPSSPASSPLYLCTMSHLFLLALDTRSQYMPFISMTPLSLPDK